MELSVTKILIFVLAVAGLGQLVLLGIGGFSKGKITEKAEAEARLYDGALALCLLHAGFLSITPWVRIGPNTDAFNKAFFNVWALLLYAWPLWIVVLVVLWRKSDRKRWRLIVPILLGIAFLIPALYFVYVMWAFSHYGPG